MSVVTVWLVQREASLCSDNVIQRETSVCSDSDSVILRETSVCNDSVLGTEGG